MIAHNYIAYDTVNYEHDYYIYQQFMSFKNIVKYSNDTH
jgi:hypothetical protein